MRNSSKYNLESLMADNLAKMSSDKGDLSEALDKLAKASELLDTTKYTVTSDMIVTILEKVAKKIG